MLEADGGVREPGVLEDGDGVREEPQGERGRDLVTTQDGKITSTATVATLVQLLLRSTRQWQMDS